MYGGTARAVTGADPDYPGRRFEYRYDAIGNRKSAGATGTSTDDAFVANALNQYDSRENKSVTVAGTAASSAKVAVQVPSAEGSASSVTRKDKAWAASITPANSSSAKAGTATIYAGIAGTPDALSVTSRSFVVMAALEQLTYDADGNLKTDGRWVYEYDAENRLRQMDTSVATRSLFGATWQRITFAYDFAGRRVEKKVATTTDGVTFTPSVWRRFIYDGWNLVAELDQKVGGTIARSYVWGLDVTGSMSRAGGVGALLQINDHSATKTWLPTYDGNGNVVSLVNSATGSLGAVYEYNPFGELVRDETIEPTLADQPFRFSTKYRDTETGLSYYGFRYYSASLGRFINRDPIGERGGANLYGFVRNNAINRWDYLGLNGEMIPLDPYIFSVDRLPDPWGNFGGSGGGGFGGGGTSEDRSEPQQPEPPKIPAQNRTEELNSCYGTARATHSAESTRLEQIGGARIESFFGSIAAQRTAARAAFGEASARTIRDSMSGVGIGLLVGAGASFQWVRAAETGRSMYATARNLRQVGAIAAEVASYQTTANYVNLGFGTTAGLTYSVLNADDEAGAFSGSIGVLLDAMLQTRFGQAGVAIGITQAAIENISDSGLSNQQVAGVIAGIRTEVNQTQQALDSRLQSALSACDKKFK